ncbi:GGDEF domain-containing protein [Actinocrinis puniceicyclus]|uniref:GGDEF domain-containing protein n=1 Tax=Actinocrinis puniceicyclus TaxID=977794 RepID=A0A8J7WMV1_9ACTN|nr:GGDEF domain-containing protein [Actinocrinis puniceicyclus]MBS2962642.1 GGDEF domain-containing protein [Actinocrinis puniceicyclus]
MTATQWGLFVLGGVCLVLAVAVARLAARLRDAAARAATELDAVRRELSGLEQGRSSLERLSATDPVTGVWNHRYLQQTLAHEIERARRIERPLALLMCDVDHFRSVNAAFGHQAGSAVLRELAQRLALEIRSFDTFARFGGEEFVVLLPDTGPQGAAVVAERLCYVARKLLFDSTLAPSSPALATSGAATGPANGSLGAGASIPVRETGEIRLTVSVGAAVFPEAGTHAATLIRAADEALAEAKRAGGDTWVVPGMAGSSALHPEATSH